MGSEEKLVETAKVLEAVKAFRKVRDFELGQNDKKSIIDVDERQNRGVHLQLTVKKMSACQRILMIPFVFPHCLLGEDDEVCFIVGCKESEKGNKRADHERYASEWKHKLRAMGIDREIHIMPVMQLETEFKSYEAKRKLCKAFDHFLCDHRIMFKMPKLLGTMFFRRRKMPIRVYMRDESQLKEAIEEALVRSLIHVTPEGPNVSIKVGNLIDHSDQQIAENIRSVLDTFIPQHLPGGEINVNSIHLASYVGKSVPLFVSLLSANEVDMSEVDRQFIDKQTPKELEDTIDTMAGVRVKVRTDGKVVAVKDDSEKLDTDDLLDEDYLDVFRDQEYEERDEAKKRYMKHLARKAALRRVGKRFGPNMLKLPSHVPIPKPKSVAKQTNMPKQSRPPPVPVFDTLQGYDDDEDHDDDDDLIQRQPRHQQQQSIEDEECPQLVPIQMNKAKKQKKEKNKLKMVAENSAAVLKKPKGKLNQQGFVVSQQSKGETVSAKANRSATSEFTLSPTQKKQKMKAKGDFIVEPQKNGQKLVKMRNKNKGMVVTKSEEKTPIGKGLTPKEAKKQQMADLSGTPRPILKTPRESIGKEKRKSVSFDFTPGAKLVGMKTPTEGDPTPIYAETPSPLKGGNKKRKSLSGGFDMTPMHGASKNGSAKKVKKVAT